MSLDFRNWLSASFLIVIGKNTSKGTTKVHPVAFQRLMASFLDMS
jgi:hypothetical protein